MPTKGFWAFSAHGRGWGPRHLCSLFADAMVLNETFRKIEAPKIYRSWCFSLIFRFVQRAQGVGLEEMSLGIFGVQQMGNFLGSFLNRQDQEEDPACGEPSCELIQSSSVGQVWRFWCVCQAFEYCTLSFDRFFLAGYLPSEGEMLSFQTTMTTMEDGLGTRLILVYISRTICLYRHSWFFWPTLIVFFCASYIFLQMLCVESTSAGWFSNSCSE